jgi:hypothetical protein
LQEARRSPHEKTNNLNRVKRRAKRERRRERVACKEELNKKTRNVR